MGKYLGVAVETLRRLPCSLFVAPSVASRVEVGLPQRLATMSLLFCSSVMGGRSPRNRKNRRRLAAQVERNRAGTLHQGDLLANDAVSRSDQSPGDLAGDDRLQRPRSRERRDPRGQPLCSPSMESFYSKQKDLFRDEADREALFRCLALPLPTCFRIVASNPFGAFVQQRLVQQLSPAAATPVLEAAMQRVQSRVGSETELEPWLFEPPVALPWYPRRLAWQVSLPRALLRRHPALQSVHEFLVTEHNFGSIHRQEAVSMIPPLLLEVEPGQRILDLCAAPGSKTAQILDLIASHSNSHREDLSATLLVANDVDRKRCWMLVHQLQRYALPAVLVTNFDASSWPLRDLTFRFDRVLCDVPCTGDGTLRKSPDLWQRWSLHQARSLHRLQLRIAIRGVEALVSNGHGRMVYSTCSLNPLENEAVVAAVLRHFGPEKLELVDTSALLPGLERRSGLVHWDAGSDSDHPTLGASLVPPTADECSWMHLERCMRIMPHDQNTGGFFVAVFRRLAAVDESAVLESCTCNGDPTNTPAQGPFKSVASSAQKIVIDTRNPGSSIEIGGTAAASTYSASSATMIPSAGPKESLLSELAQMNHPLVSDQEKMYGDAQTVESARSGLKQVRSSAKSNVVSREAPAGASASSEHTLEGAQMSLSCQVDASVGDSSNIDPRIESVGEDDPTTPVLNPSPQCNPNKLDIPHGTRSKSPTQSENTPSALFDRQIGERKIQSSASDVDAFESTETWRRNITDEATGPDCVEDAVEQARANEHASSSDNTLADALSDRGPNPGPGPFAHRMRGPRDPPLVPLNETAFGAFVIERIARCYGIRADTLETHLYCRVYRDQCSETPSKRLRLHWLTDSVRAMLACHRHRPERLLLAGIRAFEAMELHQSNTDTKDESKFWFRIVHEAVPTLLPHVAPERVITLPATDLRTLLRETCLSSNQLGFRLSLIDNIRTRTYLENLSLGPVILCGTLIPAAAGSQESKIPLFLSAWKTSVHSISLFVPSEEAQAIGRALVDPSE